MPDGGAQSTRGADLDPEERARRQELREARARDYVRERMATAGIGSAPAAYAKQESVARYIDEEGEIPYEDRSRAAFAQNLASIQALDSLANDAASAPSQDEIQGRFSSVNGFLLHFLFYLIAFDISTFGLLTWLTLPLYDVIILGIFGYELYNGVTGNKSLIPYFPELTWESLTTPGILPMSLPLPQTVLYILVFWIILGLLVWNIVWGGLIAFALYALNDPLAATSVLGDLFPFLTTLSGT